MCILPARMSVHLLHSWFSLKLEEGISSPAAGAINCGAAMCVLGTELRSSRRSGNADNCWVISPTLKYVFLFHTFPPFLQTLSLAMIRALDGIVYILAVPYQSQGLEVLFIGQGSIAKRCWNIQELRAHGWSLPLWGQVLTGEGSSPDHHIPSPHPSLSTSLLFFLFCAQELSRCACHTSSPQA